MGILSSTKTRLVGVTTCWVLAGAERFSGFSFGSKKVSIPVTTHLPCAVFFSDIDHEFNKVEESIRMTVAFLIRRADHSSAAGLIPRKLTEPEQRTKLAAMIGALVQNKNVLSHGSTVGFPCHHLYTNTEVFPRSNHGADAPLTKEQIERLKGKDGIVGRTINAVQVQRNAGGDFEFYLQPYLNHCYSMDDGSGDYLLNKFPFGKVVPRRLGDAKIEMHFKAEPTLFGSSAADELVNVWALDEKKFSHEAHCVRSTE
ncbi:unnamed protein product [Amoebophrya sp. A25]|nr:unnamed protein product [Amoebophrya sp. A25]|eukprot:GSA25T00019201001.1